jgi:predicted Zn-dependent peptidase
MRVLWILIVLAAALPARGESTRLHVPAERYVLPNGLTVILHEDHRLPTVVVDIWFRVGSKDERSGRSGFAHLFEHLMFMGTHNVPDGRFDGIMEAAGGQNNASTTEDRTNYFDWGPTNLLETFLWLEADRMATLADDMTKKKLDLQRDVVKNERRQRNENQPYGGVELVLPEKLYPEGHPYHHPVIGSHADLSAASVDDVKGFFRDYYVPANASLVISGDFQPAQARKLVEKYFGWMTKKPVPEHATPPSVVLKQSERVQLTDAVQNARVVLAWHSPAVFQPGDAECDLLAAVLGGGKASRLHQSLVYQQKLAEEVEVEQQGLQYGSQFVVTVTAQAGHTAAELERAIDAELRKLQTAPVSARELERARAYVQTQQLQQIASPFGIADALNAFEFAFADPAQLEKRYLARYDAVTLEAVRKQIKATLGAPRVTVEVAPRDTQAAGGGR